MCCTRLAQNTGRKKVAINRHLSTIGGWGGDLSARWRHQRMRAVHVWSNIFNSSWNWFFIKLGVNWPNALFCGHFSPVWEKRRACSQSVCEWVNNHVTLLGIRRQHEPAQLGRESSTDDMKEWRAQWQTRFSRRLPLCFSLPLIPTSRMRARRARRRQFDAHWRAENIPLTTAALLLMPRRPTPCRK